MLVSAIVCIDQNSGPRSIWSNISILRECLQIEINVFPNSTPLIQEQWQRGYILRKQVYECGVEYFALLLRELGVAGLYNGIEAA